MPARYRIAIQVEEAFAGQVDPRQLRAAVRAALEHQAAGTPATLTVAITGDEALRDLNRDHLGHDYPTDVLSFPSEEVDPDTGVRYLGDLAISYPRALAQAQAGGHAVEAELLLLAVHGVLHLLGHDHARAADRKRMWAAQAEILQALGIKPVLPS